MKRLRNTRRPSGALNQRSAVMSKNNVVSTPSEFINGSSSCWNERRYTNGSLIFETRGYDGVGAWEAAGAGKRGKKVRIVNVGFPPSSYGDTADINHKFMKAVVECTTIEEVQALAQIAKQRFVAETMRGKGDGYGYYSSYVDTKRGIDVEAVEDAPIIRSSEEYSIRCDKQSFTLADLRDQHNDPRVIPTGNQGAQARKAYSLLAKLDEATAAKMGFSDMWSYLTDNGVKTHYYCALD